MRRLNLMAASLISFALTGTAALAADLELLPATPPKAQTSMPVQTSQPNCSRWTDDCVNCSRGGNGEAPICSNIGFACQPKTIRCLAP